MTCLRGSVKALQRGGWYQDVFFLPWQAKIFPDNGSHDTHTSHRFSSFIVFSLHFFSLSTVILQSIYGLLQWEEINGFIAVGERNAGCCRFPR